MHAATWNRTAGRALAISAAAIAAMTVLASPASAAWHVVGAGETSQTSSPVAEQQETAAPLAEAPEDSQGSVADTACAPPWVLFPAEPVSDYGFMIDYRYRALCGSVMSYEFGNPYDNYTPWSKLRFPLNSSWHGFQTGIERPEWAVHVEWLTPVSNGVTGTFCDYDWNPPNADGTYTDLGVGSLRWNDGQMVNLDAECKGCDSVLGFPIEVWQVFGFRWQRLSVTAYDTTQLLYENQPVNYYIPGDIITHNQQYYTFYLGGQLRKAIPVGEKEIRLTFQADWGYVWGYGIDNHLDPSVAHYTMLQTHGGSWHLGMTAEVPLSQRLSVGVQGDYTEIRTTGDFWQVFPDGITDKSSYGVGAGSEQAMITAFVRLHY